MDKELYDELMEIEDRLYDIVDVIGDIRHSELAKIWSELYSYLEKVKPDEL